MPGGLKPALINAYLNRGPALRGGLERFAARIVPARGELKFYWSAEDPYSAVMALRLQAMLAGTGVHCRVFPVPLSAGDVNPEPELRVRHALRDCHTLAGFYPLEFPRSAQQPAQEDAALAYRVVAQASTLEVAAAVSAALWSNDSAALAEAQTRFGSVSAADAERVAASNAQRQRSEGHYHPGAVRWLGEWFESPTRLPHLADRLRQRGYALDPALPPLPEPSLTAAPSGTPLEMWFSFRSPYSYIAIALLDRWRQAGDVFDVTFRPVLPMVMRGLAVPRIKRMYIVKDCAREARRRGIPFGHIADPVGAGAERCLAVCATLIAADGDTQRAFTFAVSASRGIWSEAYDVATDLGLRAVAERAGVSVSEVDTAVANLPAGAALAATNRDAMTGELGLWGVPSFRCGDLTTWGQDRLPLIRHVLGLRGIVDP